MNKYLLTFIFYITSIGIILLLNIISPNAHDGGLGLASLAIILMLVVVFGLVVVNIYKGFKKNKEYFLIAAMHVLVLLGTTFSLFL